MKDRREGRGSITKFLNFTKLTKFYRMGKARKAGCAQRTAEDGEEGKAVGEF
jgi:hypothetical protein